MRKKNHMENAEEESVHLLTEIVVMRYIDAENLQNLDTDLLKYNLLRFKRSRHSSSSVPSTVTVTSH